MTALKMLIPFFLKKRIYRNLKSGTGSFEGMSFFIVSKNEGKYEFEIMTKISDNKYEESLDAYADFSGLMVIEDIFGEFVKGYTIDGGKILGAVKKAEHKDDDACVPIEWYSFEDNGKMMTARVLSHIEYYCPDPSIVPLAKDNIYTSIGRISRSVRERRYVHPEHRIAIQLITGNPTTE